jgi:two-component system, NtrC family, response regulator AtoC
MEVILMGGKILVVDDEARICMALARMLQRSGYAVEEAGGGADALRRLCDGDGHKDFRLIIMDLQMGNMGGLEVLEQLQSRSIFVPVLPMTGHSDRRTQDELRKYGCCDPLIKPFNKDELMNRIEGILGNGN